MKYKYPKEVPVLEGKDFKKGCRCECKGSRCYVEWINSVFHPEPESLGYLLDGEYVEEVPERVYQTFYKELQKEAPEGLLGEEDFDLYSCWIVNDYPYTPRKKLAAAFNRATAKLGYVVGNPEGQN